MSNSCNKKRKLECETSTQCATSLICLCGIETQSMTASQAYPEIMHGSVSCNACSHQISVVQDTNITFYHCPNGKTEQHDKGYDLCAECAASKLQPVHTKSSEPAKKRRKLNIHESESSSEYNFSSDHESDDASNGSESNASICICYCDNDEPVRPMFWRCVRCHRKRSHVATNSKMDIFIVMMKITEGNGYDVCETNVKVKDVWNNRDNANESALEIFEKESYVENHCLKKSYKNGLFNENDKSEHYVWDGAHYHWVHVWVESHIVC